MDIFYKEFDSYFDAMKLILEGRAVYDLAERLFFVKFMYYDRCLKDFDDVIKFGIFYPLECENKILMGSDPNLVYSNCKNIYKSRNDIRGNLELVLKIYNILTKDDCMPSNLNYISSVIQKSYHSK